MVDFAKLQVKTKILAAAARYDASCASSGSNRRRNHGLGSGLPSGVCHSWSADGRCISLLKLLLSNACAYDCAYCVNRSSRDGPRATLTAREVAELTVNFYRRNYIEGLFLSTGLFASPDETMERMVEAARLLRMEYRFQGYIHLKLVPGTSPLLVEQAGRLADRISINIELPSTASLQQLAPDKNRDAILVPMRQAAAQIVAAHAERRKSKQAPLFAPAGQSTQLIVGASPESDRDILSLSSALYRKLQLKRVYYSAYVPVGKEGLCLQQPAAPPLLREHRLYQADWLLRFYGFTVEELLDETRPHLDLSTDPKAAWALSRPELFPVEIRHADLEILLRVPGIGMRSARRIVTARRHARLDAEDLCRLGVVLKRARWFLTVNGRYLGDRGGFRADRVCRGLTGKVSPENSAAMPSQLPLFPPASVVTGEF